MPNKSVVSLLFIIIISGAVMPICGFAQTRYKNQLVGYEFSISVKDSTEKVKNEIHYSLDGFGISFAPTIINKSGETGKVKVEFCVTRKGEIIESSLKLSDSSSTVSSYLKELSVSSTKQFQFYVFYQPEAKRCGYIEFNFLKKNDE